MKILALDIATVTGWACGDTTAFLLAAQPADRAIYGAVRLNRRGLSWGAKFDAQYQALYDLAAQHTPCTIVCEAPFAGKSTTTNRQIFGLSAIADMAFHNLGLMRGHDIQAVYEVPPQTWRKHFLGKGRGPREEMKAAALTRCRQLGFEPDDDNAADALGLLDYAMHRFMKHGF